MGSFYLLVLAAGEGKRMKSKRAKVSFPVCQKPLVNWVLDSAREAGTEAATVVVGHCAEQVIALIENRADFVTQTERLGTGHAVMQAKHKFSHSENVLALTGDTPLITPETLRGAMEEHIKSGNSATVITAQLSDPDGYGRIVRGAAGEVLKIVEHKDAGEKELAINEINSGMYCFKTADLLFALDGIKNENAQGEYYLTDALEILRRAGKRVGAFAARDGEEILGINDRVQLERAERVMRRRINRKLALDGVTIMDFENTYIGADVKIGMDSVVYPNTIIEGKTVVGENVTIGPNCKIVGSVIRNGAVINGATILDSVVDEKATVGPYAYIRPHCEVGKNCKVGDFVELKNAKLGDGTKASHLTYIGDALVGKNVNFGCGTIFVNYDGKKKHLTEVEDNAFIGCNSNLVSPVKVGEGAYIAAGSTITENVPPGSLAIARTRQINKLKWNDKRK